MSPFDEFLRTPEVNFRAGSGFFREDPQNRSSLQFLEHHRLQRQTQRQSCHQHWQPADQSPPDRWVKPHEHSHPYLKFISNQYQGTFS